MDSITKLYPWLQPVVIFVGFLVVWGGLHWLFEALLKYLIKKLNLPAGTNLIMAFRIPVRCIIFTIAFCTALNVSPLSYFLVYPVVRNSAHSFLIFCFYWIAYNLSSSTNDLFIYILKRNGVSIDLSLSNILSTCIHTILILLGIASLLGAWDINVSGFVAGLSIGGLAFSLAAKDSLSNIFAGLVILVDKPFKVGDWIICRDIEGTVEKIDFRSTSVRTFPQALVYIPNSIITNTSIVNYSNRESRRINFTLGVTYDTTPQQMEELVSKIHKLLLNDHDILADGLSVAFTNMNSSSLDIDVICFTSCKDYGSYVQVKERINLNIMNILKEIGTSAAFPSTSLYVEKLPDKLHTPTT